ncbi:MAG: hypothetical protein IKZ86_05620 [Spirochaetaceae bacterium]|nr:hypothetical protein [Spirochaetaceae bacterium]
MKKYNSYSYPTKICIILGIIFCLWVFSLNINTIDWFFICFFAIVVLSYVEISRKIKIDNDIISRKNIFFKNQTMAISEIEKYDVYIKNENILTLYSADKKMKIPFADANFVADFSEILRKRFKSAIEQKVKSFMENGFQISSIRLNVKFDGIGITNLKTGKEFPWKEVKCIKKETKNKILYKFQIDTNFNFNISKKCFDFAYEDFLAEVSKRCIKQN